MHDQVISLWKNFGLENDQAMLDNLKVPGESMGAFKLGPILKCQEVHQMHDGGNFVSSTTKNDNG